MQFSFGSIAAIACAILGFWVTAALAAEGASPPRVDVLDSCRPKTACIAAAFALPDADKRRVVIQDGVCGRTVFELRGRLNGGVARVYRVSLAGTCTDCGNEGLVAFVGQSKLGNPIVQTAKGRLEILERGVRIGHPRELVLIHARSAKVVATYWGPTRPTGNDFYFEDSQVFLANGDGPCFAAPQDVPRILIKAPSHCRDRAGRIARVPVDTTSEALEATLRKIGGGEIPGGGTFVKVPGTELFALETADPC